MLPVLVSASVATTQNLRRARLVACEQRLDQASSRGAEFKVVAHTSRNGCSQTTPPEPLATPDPLLDTLGQDSRITVSFIIGPDGHIHSPLILESAGSVRDRVVLRTVQSWKFRAATCNGVPTEAEGKIDFSRR